MLNKLFFIFITLFTFLISCAQLNNSTQTLELVTITPLSTEPSKTVQPSQTTVSTPSFNSFENLIALTPDNQRLISLIENPLCSLPCWWTIIPGESDWNYTKRVLQLLGENPILYNKDKEYSSYDVTYYIPDSIYFINLRLHTNKNIVDFISINSFLDQSIINSRLKIYNPKTILGDYGTPSRIYLRIYSNNTINYSMSFFYDEQKFLITYGGYVNTTNSINSICPNMVNGDISGITIYSQSPEIKTLIELYPAEKKIFDIEKYSWRPVLQSTGLTIDEFSKLIMTEDDVCFEIKE